MGEVHLAKAIGGGGFEKLVALKVLTPAAQSGRKHVDSLQREAQIGVHLDHDNIVQILDYGEAEGRHFVAMEYVRGFSLEHVLRYAAQQERVVPLQVIVHVIRTVTDALQYVHDQSGSDGAPLGLVHGDVTPSNVMLSYDGRIKLADFGIAALTRELGAQGTVAGKPRYVPPDALRGESQSQGSDLYALGVTLWEALTGSVAFESYALEQLRDDAARVLASPTELRSDCPPALAALTLRAVRPRGADRFGTARELRQALDEAVPRLVNDQDAHTAFVTELYRRDSFVRDFGQLPSTASLGRIGELAPHVTSSTDATIAPPRQHKPLRFGMSPALSSDLARKNGEQLCALLGAQLGREVQSTVFGDYQTLVDCLTRGDVDFAWTPPETFVEVFQRGGGMLGVMERCGRVAFEAAVIVRDESELRSLQELRGTSAAWVDRRSASGYVFVKAELLRQLQGPSPILGREHFHGSHRAVIEAVHNGWADFGSTYVIRSDDGAVLHASGWTDLLPDRARDLRPLAFVGPIPGDNLSHSPQLPMSVVEELVGVLVHLHETEEGRETLREVFGAERLVYGEFDLYGPVVAALDVIEVHDHE